MLSDEAISDGYGVEIRDAIWEMAGVARDGGGERRQGEGEGGGGKKWHMETPNLTQYTHL